MSTKVYLVVGESGKYEEYTHWRVAVFQTEESATQLCKNLQALANKAYQESETTHDWEATASGHTLKTMDPEADLEWSSRRATYSVHELEYRQQ
jgi:hypothetical protein